MILLRAVVLSLCVVALKAQVPDSTPAPEYGGPTVLSRGGAASNTGTAPVQFRPYIHFSGLYEAGLTPVTISSTGRLTDEHSFGAEATIGAYAYHRWRRTKLHLDYRGTYHHYTQAQIQALDGTDQTLDLSLTHQLSRRTSLTLRESAGTYIRRFGYGLSAYDPTALDIPTDSLFDNRTSYLSTGADLTIQKSTRLSVNLGGTGYLVRRHSAALYGVTGYTGRVDVAYRISKFTTISADYNFIHFEYLRAFGASDLHMGAIGLAFRLSPTVELALRGGAYRMESLFLSRVAVDPVVAAITGQSVGIVATYALNYSPVVGARLSFSQRRSSLQFSYEQGISPGNGVYIAARMQQAGAAYSYSGLRHWNVGMNGGYDSISSSIGLLGRYKSYMGGVGVTRDLRAGIHLVLRFDARRYELVSGNFDRVQYRASIGFAYSPGELPLSLW